MARRLRPLAVGKQLPHQIELVVELFNRRLTVEVHVHQKLSEWCTCFNGRKAVEGAASCSADLISVPEYLSSSVTFS